MTIVEEARAKLDAETRQKKVDAAAKLIVEIDKLEESIEGDQKRLTSLKAQLEGLNRQSA